MNSRVKSWAIVAARRAVPEALLPAIVQARLQRALRDPAVLDDARAHMEFLLAESRPDADIEAAARRYIEFMIWRAEQRWHPATLNRLPVEGLEHLTGLQRRGQGAVINFMHHGPEGYLISLARAGAPCHVLVDKNTFDPNVPAHTRQQLRITSMGNIPVSTSIGRRGIEELLMAGHTVAVASDVPGRTPVTFAGRRLLGSFGAALSAMSTGSPVVLSSAHAADDGSAFIRLAEPLWPADFDSPQALLAAMISGLEPSVLDWPEAADLPLDRWHQVDEEPARSWPQSPGQDSVTA